MSKKLLLISGCPRSGTTLMNIILNSHKEISITNEINLFSIINDMDDIFYKREKKINAKIFGDKNIDRKRSIRETWDTNILLDWIPKKDKSKMKIIYDLCSSIKDSKIIVYGDKTPTYYRKDISHMAKDLNQDIYLMHVSRVPFEVISSIDRRIKNSKQGKDYWKFILDRKSAINEWILAWNSRKVLSKCERINFLDINYNAFIKNPNYGVEIISNFLEVNNEFDTSIVNNFKLNHTIKKDDVIKFAPQLKEISNVWDEFGIILDRYDQIKLIEDNFYEKLKKNIYKKIKYLKNLILLTIKND